MGTSLPSYPSVIHVSYTFLFGTQFIVKHFKAKILTFRFNPPPHKSGGTCYALRKNKNRRVFGSFAFAVFVQKFSKTSQIDEYNCEHEHAMHFVRTKIFAKMTLKNVCEDLICYAFFAQINSKTFTPTFFAFEKSS